MLRSRAGRSERSLGGRRRLLDLCFGAGRQAGYDDDDPYTIPNRLIHFNEVWKA